MSMRTGAASGDVAMGPWGNWISGGGSNGDVFGGLEYQINQALPPAARSDYAPTLGQPAENKAQGRKNKGGQSEIPRCARNDTDPLPQERRDYVPTLGRWMVLDPGGRKVVKLANPQTWNMYAYVTDDPTTLNDPSGLQCQGGSPGCINKTVAGAVVIPTYKGNAGRNLLAQNTNSTTSNGNVIYNETSGFRPTTKKGNGSGTNMHAARVDIGHVLLNRQKGHIPGGVARSTVPARDRNNPEYRDSQAAAAQAGRSPDPTHGATHFYLNYPGERTPPWARGRTPAATFGPFRNAAGGGDVPKGADVWIVIIP